jgi:hypothetical protein
MKIEMTKLRADRRALETRIRAIKALLGTTWTAPMADLQRELHACKREATELCILRAHLRGKQHLPDADRCREVAERRMVQYAIQEAA